MNKALLCVIALGTYSVAASGALRMNKDQAASIEKACGLSAGSIRIKEDRILIISSKNASDDGLKCVAAELTRRKISGVRVAMITQWPESEKNK